MTMRSAGGGCLVCCCYCGVFFVACRKHVLMELALADDDSHDETRVLVYVYVFFYFYFLPLTLERRAVKDIYEFIHGVSSTGDV